MKRERRRRPGAQEVRLRVRARGGRVVFLLEIMQDGQVLAYLPLAPQATPHPDGSPARLHVASNADTSGLEHWRSESVAAPTGTMPKSPGFVPQLIAVLTVLPPWGRVIVVLTLAGVGVYGRRTGWF
jgi:hypothetical protein